MSDAGMLAGKVAVVIGGGRGIGRAVSLALADAGAHVHVVARTGSQLDETVRQIESRRGSATATVLDASRPEAIFDELKPRVERLSGPPDILVNSVGVFGPIQLVVDAAYQEWIDTINFNLIAPYLSCRAFAGGMIAKGWGRIINVTSAASLHPPGPLNSAYSTSKVALNQFTRSLATELVGTGVTANVLHPGEVKTEMWRYIKEQADSLGEIGEPLRDWARDVGESGGDPPEKTADLVLTLVDADSGSINGEFLWIKDGRQDPIPTD
jgi:NAD(P)-dependent dehydrogenase (short-subunit alcohol dehydrogenase family)